MNLSYIFGHGDVVLITTFLLLIGMSAVSWYIIFWKAWTLYQERLHLEQFKAHYVTTPDWPKHTTIKTAGGCLKSLMDQARIVQPTLPAYELKERKEILGMHLAQALDKVRVWMDRGLTILASVGSSAPFIGLFGTVWGIYGALTQIAAAGNASLNVVAGPMGEALVATAVGLFAAIPAVLAYNTYVRANRLLIQDYRHIAEQMTLYLSQHTNDNTRSESGTIKLVAGE